MPRVAQQSTNRTSSNPLLAHSNSHPNVLKRNQACHQCRRRKLKCDAKRPCSTCLRSHAHAVAHAAPGAVMPPKPECTFDDVAEVNANVPEGPKNNNVVCNADELEALLRQQDNNSSSSTNATLDASNRHSGAGVSHVSDSLSNHSPQYAANGASIREVNSFGLEVMWPNWPPSLPGPELLRHFLYTAAVTSPPLPNFNEVAPDEIFLERFREHRPDSFAEAQAKLARDSAERLNALGEHLFQVLQTNIVLTWFYWSHGRWVDMFLSSAHSMRLSVPLGLNVCPPFHSITKSERPPSILAPARTVIEDETRRNAFWLAYATERQHGCGNGWALSLDDQDVNQLLPVRGDQFMQGALVKPVERQWAQSRDLLLVHPENQTDSFMLYIKGTVLISRVKAFNLRYRSKHFAGDSSVATLYPDAPQDSTDPVDPRGSAAFIELDHAAASFHASFPTRLRSPIKDNIVDNHLYAACLMPLVCTVILHDPHAEVRQSGCISALKILTAARSILDLIYDVWSTSYDITLLDTFCIFCWFIGARVLVRFLQAALDARSLEQMSTLRSEIDFVHSAISKVGERIPLAHRLMAKPLPRQHFRPSALMLRMTNEILSQVPLAVVPQENSIFGNVIETYDLLRTADPTFICGEITLKVKHCLLVRKGVKLHQIKRIMSHEQALGQCRSFIAEKLPSACTIKTSSTAAAARTLFDNPPDCAAICSNICATLFEGLEILFAGIQNEQSNFTRFYIAAYTRSFDLPPVLASRFEARALVRLSAASPSSPDIDTCGYDIMEYLKLLLVDLFAARIDRRPSLERKPFHNVYFVEVQGSLCGARDTATLEVWTAEVEKAITRTRAYIPKPNLPPPKAYDPPSPPSAKDLGPPPPGYGRYADFDRTAAGGANMPGGPGNAMIGPPRRNLDEVLCFKVFSGYLAVVLKPNKKGGSQHTSAGLTVNENYDKDVRRDMDMALDTIVPESLNWRHTDEGPDDSVSHTKASLVGSSVMIPITDGRLNLGTWQGIYLTEFRHMPHSRRIVATVLYVLISTATLQVLRPLASRYSGAEFTAEVIPHLENFASCIGFRGLYDLELAYVTILLLDPKA
ncbi:hypothetical protein NLJ89_g2412 [Agrocybe chaxingu]|uniref:Zn(2)-C6 fungal-type domain-containing protein n=1 Tax=Agrocybe chaxingu TaxID=84603 RepID=A0A9W8K7J2_9AGAR|nr:hypothetical protein NLJ89_g2412 [Agrocybe chaxingu]